MTAAGRQKFLDVTRLAGRLMNGRTMTGIDRVCLAYVERFGAESCAVLRYRDRLLFFSPASSRKIFSGILARRPLTFMQMAFLFFRDWLFFAHPATADAVLFNVSHGGLENPSYLPAVAKSGVKPLFIVHDLIPITHPEYAVPGEKQRHIARIANMLKGGAALLTISRATLDDLSAFAANNNMTMPPARVALLGTTPFAAAAPPPVAAPYFVLLGTIEPRKNHLLVLNVWRALARTMGAALPRLVIIGHRGWECENIIDMIERCDALRDHVIEVPHCTDAMLSGYLAGAQALLFPSFTEGFGMPLCEALQLGTPVIAADLPVFREVAAGIPEYLDPLDGAKWAEAIASYSTPGSERAAHQKARMEGFVPPSWQAHFAVVDKVLEDMERERAHG